jgi:hypothetical protein
MQVRLRSMSVGVPIGPSSPSPVSVSGKESMSTLGVTPHSGAEEGTSGSVAAASRLA